MFSRYPLYKFVLAACDYTLLLAAWAIAICLRFYDLSWVELLSRPLVRTQGALLLAYSLIWIVVFQHFGLYKLNLFMTIGPQFVAIVRSLLYGLAGLVALTFAFRGLDFVDSRLVIAIFSVTSALTIWIFRILIFRPVFSLLSEKKLIQRRVLVIGKDRTAKTVAANMAYDSTHGFEVVGFANEDLPVGHRVFNDLENVGPISELDRIVRDLDVDEIIVAESDVTHNKLLEIIDKAQATSAKVRLVSELYNIIPEKVLLEHYLGIPIVRMPQNYGSVLLVVYKRVFDVVVTSFALIFLSLPLLIIAALIKFTSDGPALHRQTRIGKDCMPFTFYKFRTMVVGSDDAAHREFVTEFIRSGADSGASGVRKITDDPRVTAIGRILRKTSLDELPQLFNVLKGEMSLVGPRPCLPYELEQYEDWHRRRLSVIPGCTGLWQVAGRSAVDFNDMVILDLFYIDNMSPLFDLRIIAKTLPVMLLAKGGH